MAPSTDGSLQFERVEQSGSAGVVCRVCKSKINAVYFALGSEPMCASCKAAVDAAEDASRTWPRFARAALYGAGAAIAGAILYYAVIAITNLEIGIVAIVIGYMVGYAVLKGAGRGRRRFQVLALVLTYASVGLAYMPIAVKEIANKPLIAASKSAAPEAPSRETPRPQPSFGGFVTGIAMLIAFSLALPALVVIGSMPSGLISALIIGFGMRQAWRMTAPPSIDVTGPYRVAAAAVPVA